MSSSLRFVTLTPSEVEYESEVLGLKRLLIHVAAFNLSLILRREVGIRTPRSLQGRRERVFFCFWLVWMVLEGFGQRPARQQDPSASRFRFPPLPDQTLCAA